VVIVLSLILLAQVWGLGFGSAPQLADGLWSIALILFLAYLGYQAARIAIDRRIAEEMEAMPVVERGDEGGGATTRSRLATLLPLVRSFLLFTILIVAAMVLLLELGVDVSPVFAGAGVIGIALGLGAQALIQDIISGVFFLIDDAFRTGEYIEVGPVKGTVERISLRSFQLRHHLGALHTVPFGQITSLTNFSRDWVIMKLPLRLVYGTDVEKVRKLIKKLGQELQQDPTIGHTFVEPLKSQGVYQMEDSAMIIRVKFMTRPGDQFQARKLIYRRIHEVFQENGIEFASREVRVHLSEPGAGPLTPEQKEQVAAAARRTLDDADAAAGMSTPTDQR